MNKNILKYTFYLNIIYLFLYFLSMLSGNSGFFELPIVYVSYIGLICFIINIVLLCVFRKIYNSNTNIITALLIVLCILHFFHETIGNISPSLSDFLAFVIPLSFALLFERALFYKAISDMIVKKVFVSFFVIAVIMFLVYKHSAFYTILGGSLHAIYYIVILLPIIFLLKGDFCKYFALFTVLILSVLSYKRGAIIAITLISMIFVLMQIKKAKKGRKIFNITLLAGTIGSLLYIYQLGGSDLERTMERFENLGTDGGSGRNEIYEYFITRISEFSIFEHLMGLGAKSTAVFYNELTAHNDWIEIYFDYGIIAFSLWLLFIINQVKICFKSFHDKNGYSIMLVSVLLTYITISMISHIMIYAYFSIVLIYITYINFKINENRYSYIS